MDLILHTEDLCLHYGGHAVLDGLSMHIPRGAIYGFVGRNGAGKTTLIRTICGLQVPTEGNYCLFGMDYRRREIAQSRRRMGAVIETPALYGDMTAEENLREQALMLGVRTDISGLLREVGLADTGRKRVRHFSLGMKQRLGIAVALVGDPEFLVLDEPINGLDPQGIVQLRELIGRLNRERGITFLISSHILPELGRLATHYGFIDGGRLLREISAAEIEEKCRSYVRVTADDNAVLRRFLAGAGIEHTTDANGSVLIYGRPAVSELTLALHERGCTLLSWREEEETVEQYYLSLLGGGDDD